MALSAEAFSGPFSHLAGSLAFRPHPDAMAVADLDGKAVFDDVIARFATGYAGGERQALVSLWSQYYFAKLLIPVMVLCLSAERPLWLRFDDIRVRFCPEQGVPLCFHLGCENPARPAEVLVRALYEEHVAAMVARLKRHDRLSARLSWENAASYGMWILGEIGRARPASLALVENLLGDPSWPRAGCAMVAHHKLAARSGQAARRRVCCLRYLVPPLERCETICPLAPQDGRDRG